MEINNEYLHENYEEIWKTTLTKGIPIPYLLKNPIEHQNLDIADLKLSDATLDKLDEAYTNRRTVEYELWHETKSKKKRNELFQDYTESELIDWVKKFPQFAQVIITE